MYPFYFASVYILYIFASRQTKLELNYVFLLNSKTKGVRTCRLNTFLKDRFFYPFFYAYTKEKPRFTTQLVKQDFVLIISFLHLLVMVRDSNSQLYCPY